MMFGHGSRIQFAGYTVRGIYHSLMAELHAMPTVPPVVALVFGGKMSRLRYRFLLDVCFEIGCLQKSIYFEGVSFRKMLSCVFLDVGWWNRRITYFYIVMCLVRFGILFVIG